MPTGFIELLIYSTFCQSSSSILNGCPPKWMLMILFPQYPALFWFCAADPCLEAKMLTCGQTMHGIVPMQPFHPRQGICLSLFAVYWCNLPSKDWPCKHLNFHCIVHHLHLMVFCLYCEWAASPLFFFLGGGQRSKFLALSEKFILCENHQSTASNFFLHQCKFLMFLTLQVCGCVLLC